MNETTKQFVKDRQPFCETELRVVFVNKIGGGKEGACLDNTFDNADNMDDVRIVSGWLVYPYDTRTKGADILQHWWNMDVDGNYFDSTPDIPNICEHLLDMDLIKFVRNNFDAIQSNVASSLILKNGKYTALEADMDNLANVREFEIESLATKHLYKLI